MQRIIHLRTCNRNVCHNILIGWKRKAYLSLRLFAKLLLFHGVSVRYKIKSFIQMIFDIARTNNYLKNIDVKEHLWIYKRQFILITNDKRS